ncbi:ATPase [Algimonas arctica]|uniref:ATPase n=1 Tax=Algimonas arctica TaxID=1479486 RepID=A0A8J3G184_9PROT|nr:ATP-binding protein [Algimonas arctica]GHA83885.1 ATPase [Algimonas arctica]
MIPQHPGLKQAMAPGGSNRRPLTQIEVGRILNVGSAEAIISINKSVIRDNKLSIAQIGTMLKILTSDSIVVGMVSSLKIGSSDTEGMADGCHATLNILGEISTNATTRETKFNRGVRTFPVLGEAVYTMSATDLQIIFSKETSPCIEIGRLQQDNSIIANVRIDDMLSKHFAIIGSTGSGKSCTVALILQAILSASPAGHVVLFDPHNEYSKSFGDRAEVITGETLDLPLWMFDFVETVELLTSDIEDQAREEEEILNDVILMAKRLFDRSMAHNDTSAQVKLDDVEMELQRATHISLDSPVPYRIRDVVKLIDHEMGKLENSSNLQPYKRLKRRIQSLMADPRYAFIFRNQAKPRPLEETIGRIFRLPVNGKPISILDFSSIPSETLNIVVAVVSRLAFELATWSERKVPILLVCEEAHRYIPRDASQGFHATRRIISRIAKEGRKYGVSLGIISQRPSELEPSTLSQCSTIFSMRLSNEIDQNFVRAAVPDGAAELLTFLPSLGTAETMVFGEAVNLPMRVLLNNLPEEYRPHSSSASFTKLWARDTSTPEMMERVYASWKTRTHRDKSGGIAEPVFHSAPRAVAPNPAELTLAQRVAAAPSLQRPSHDAGPSKLNAIRNQPQSGREIKNLLNAAFHRET